MKVNDLSFSDLRKKVRIKFDTHTDPMQMAQQLLEVDSLEDFPRMIQQLKPEIWCNFWKEEANEFKNEVLTI